MATLLITNHVAKGFRNVYDGSKFTWWKTSFNMPVPYLFTYNDNSPSWPTETTGMLESIWESTSFDLSGYEAWWEVVALHTVFTIIWPFAGWIMNCKQEWRNASWVITNPANNNQDVVFGSIPAWRFSYHERLYNQGVASWEIDSSQTFTVSWIASWAMSGSVTNNITFSNVPNTSTTYTPGMTWVEGNDLRWSSANWHLHTMVWVDIANPWATPGFIWVEGNYIYWIGTSWHKYRWPYNFQQFTSSFYNGPSPWYVSGQVPWMTWMDTNFWYEHIGYIASDGTKWINNSWENPYA